MGVNWSLASSKLKLDGHKLGWGFMIYSEYCWSLGQKLVFTLVHQEAVAHTSPNSVAGQYSG